MILEQLEKYNIISFDIFDTLLLRNVANPRDVFEQVWEQADDIKLTDISKKEFMKLRMEMERRARNKKKEFNREVVLSEIYAEFPKFIVSDIEKLERLEVETEKRVCYRNDFMWEIAKKLSEKGKRLVLLSDMYLKKKDIVDILEVNGIDTSIFEHIIISCEERCSKQNGKLFDVLFSRLGDVDKKNIVHVGDNKNADYTQPLSAGISAVHYDAIPDKLNSIYDYEKIRHDIPQKKILSLRKVVSYHGMQKYSDDLERQAYEIGSSIVGPFLTTYISYVCDRLEKSEIKRIYPFMREGYILGKLLEKEAASRDMELDVRPIYISRKVTYIPSIKKIDREEIENMIGARNLTVSESLRLMGLEPESIEHEILEKYGDLRWKDSHTISYSDTTLKEHLINVFLQKENIEKMEKYVSDQRKLLVAYLKQEIGDMENIATIDIGFFGRIQMWMEQALKIENIPYKMKHFLAIGLTGDKIYDGMDFEGYYSTFAENTDLVSTIHRTTDILEKFISVTEGSTIGYEIKNDRIVPVKSVSVNNEKVTRASFEGTLDFQKAFHAFRKQRPDEVKKIIENRRESLMLLHRLIDMPRLSEARLIKQMEADTNFGTEYKKTIITEENLRLLEEKGTDFVDKCNVSYTYKGSNIVWPKGVVTLGDEYYYVRRAMKNGAGNEIAKAMQEVVEKVQSDGVTEVSLYGAGENGRQFYFICSLYHIKVNAFIDRKESIWGTKKEGIPVMGLDEAMEKGNDTYIVTSLFSISEISEFIKEKYGRTNRVARIYSV
ncbi:hypothetical protein KQI69_00065 [Eubacterium sp. MSJ-13]|uniref:HAD family hydrolase n=1 Tax=Eubacterium sp. MSJ-13 TaxID=2841513 RepID=UPI001C113148|nr:HAD family hydrolase [Eubacterium sp. MSJ-13]MBU5477598.1 hypothetical protein [Eubacterium sp. MSJ-13]